MYLMIHHKEKGGQEMAHRTRQEQEWASEETYKYHTRREQYLRGWALDIVRSAGATGDAEAVRNMPVSELQKWYDEVQARS